MTDYWKTVLVSLTGFVGVITALTVFNNFDGILAMEFCGQLQDFTSEAAHTGCISFAEYWLRAAVYWPYTVTGALIGAGCGWTYRNIWGIGAR